MRSGEYDGQKYAATRLYADRSFNLGLDDLCVRFLMNGPKEDLETAERICFRVEEAQWYYEDFIRPLDPTLPSMTLKHFCKEIFAHCPLLLPFSQDHRMKAFDAFLSYKKRIPVRGAIMLNQDMDRLVLVKGWKKGANWSFPRGKINKDEDDLDCAIREVYEETGFDLGESGFVPADRQVKSIEMNMHEQQIRLFVFRGISMDTHFEPRTRKEISAIDWWHLSDLPAFKKGKSQVQQLIHKPTNFYMVAPFLGHVRKWIVEQKRQDAERKINSTYQLTKGSSRDDAISEEDKVAYTAVKAVCREEPSTTNIELTQRKLAGLSNHIDIPKSSHQTKFMDKTLTLEDAGSALLALLHGKSSEINKHAPNNHEIFFTHEPQTPHQVWKAPVSSEITPASILEQKEEPIIYQSYLVGKGSDTVIETHNHIQKYQNIHANRPHSHQSQHLVHPQPLPPNIQRNIFAQSPILASPLTIKPTPNTSSTLASTDFSKYNVTTVSDTENDMSLQLENHTLSLLNTLKGKKKEEKFVNLDHVQNPEQMIESQNSLLDPSPLPMLPIRKTAEHQHKKLSSIDKSSWNILPNQKIQDMLSIGQPNNEMTRRRLVRNQNFCVVSTDAIQNIRTHFSAEPDVCQKSSQVSHLGHHDPYYSSWNNKSEYCATSSRFNEQERMKKGYLDHSPPQISSQLQQTTHYNLEKNCISYPQSIPQYQVQDVPYSPVSRQPQELPASPSRMHSCLKTYSILSEAEVVPISQLRKNDKSSQDLKYDYNQKLSYRPKDISPNSQEALTSPFSALANDTFSQTSASDIHSRPRVRTLRSNDTDIRDENQLISPSTKGFLLKYLDAVVTKGTGF